MIKFVTTLFSLFFISGVLFLPAQTTLRPGDLAVVGLASNVGGDFGDCTPNGSGQFLGRDRVSFICFKDIEAGTAIDITDNGWEREKAGRWGNTEGFIRATRTGGTIPAGTLITFEFPPTNSDSEAISPDDAWDFTILGTNALNFNDSGDQIYFMQGGSWDNGTVLGCCNGEQDAAYVGGNILFAFNSKSVWNGFLEDSQNSALHPEVMPCFHMAPTSGITSFTSYSGPFTEATQLEWISRIGDPANWTTYDECETYQDPAGNFQIGSSNMFLTCAICRSCGTFTDTITFHLPTSGNPFSLTYSDGKDTFQLDGVDKGARITVSVDATTTYELISVTDVSSCPVYSNFESGAELVVQTESPLLSCTPVAPAPNGSVEFTISGGLAPYEISWVDEQGGGGSASGDGSASVTVNGLNLGGTYQATLSDAAGCTTTCSFELEGPECTLAVMLEGTDPLCGFPMSGTLSATVSGQMGEVNYLWNASGLNGNENVDLPAGMYALTVSDEAGCLDSAAVVLQEPAVFGVDLQLIGPLACDAGWGIRINEFIGGIPPFSFKIDTTDAFQSLGSLPFELLDLTAGNYSLQFEDAMGCPVTVIVPVPERNPVRDLVMDLGFDTNVQRGQGVVIDPLVNFNPVSVSWMPETAVENPNLLSTTIRPVQTTLYTATVTDENGCSVSDSILIRVIQDEKIFIPSAFSPNNDGINDRFVLFPGPEVREIRSVRIFDRWGTLVFEGSGLPDEQNAWDGSLPNRRPAGAGIYLYFLEMLDQNGVEEIIRGSLTLIR